MFKKSHLLKPFIQQLNKKIIVDKQNAIADQQKIFTQLINVAKHTQFGKERNFKDISTYEDFKQATTIVEYEQIKPYIEKIKQGEENVLWKGKPIYLAKTSGTTSGIKYIPITKESIPNHINTARNALIHYAATSKKYDFLNHKMIFLSGSPQLQMQNDIYIGRLSGIVNHHIPNYLKKNQLPSFSTNCIDNWEDKLTAIVNETKNQSLGLISGIPPWVQMYFEYLQQATGKQYINDVFPHFSLFVYGGVNFKPYEQIFKSFFNTPVDTLETFPASEGFIAFQDDRDSKELLLNTNSGIFFEFVEMNDIFSPQPKRYQLSEVKLHTPYVLIINNNAGLWAYNIGDLIQFTQLNPYKIIVVGRSKHFISAFGEHVITEEVEYAISIIAQRYQLQIVDFTVAPNINKEKSYHEWFIEFKQIDMSLLPQIAIDLDNILRKKNIYYDDLIKGNILQPLMIRPLKPNTFINTMRTMGKLGGQNKVPRLMNNRDFVTLIESTSLLNF